MNLERMTQAAISESKENDKWAVICTDGGFEFARTDDAALEIMRQTVDRTEFISGEGKHNYGLVRVDVE